MRAASRLLSLSTSIVMVAFCGFTGVAHAATQHVYPGGSISGAVASSSSGDTVVVHAGTYPKQTISKAFGSTVSLQAAPGEVVAVQGFEFLGASHLALSGLRIEPDSTSVSGVRIANQAHDISVTQSTLVGGQFNVRLYGHGSNSSTEAKPSSEWPYNIRIADSELVGAAIDNVQIDGARDMTIEHNYIHDPQANDDHNDGIQSTASDRLRILRNVLAAPGTAGPDQGIILGRANPPDSYGYRKVTNTEVVNNLVHQWRGLGIILGGTDATAVVNNTAYDNGDGTWAGFTMSAKNDPAKFQNTNARLVNNVFDRMSVGSGSDSPAVESHWSAPGSVDTVDR